MGDPAYPLCPWLMTPFPAEGALTAAQQRFNYRLSKACVIIERAFGKLKSRWCCLLKQLEESTDRVPQTIITCCILHNICMHMDDSSKGGLYGPRPIRIENWVPRGMIGPMRLRGLIYSKWR